MKRYFCLLILVIEGCKEVYNPPVKVISTGYLVVEGNIVANNDSTFIHLSRTTPLNDTSGINKPESNASVKVESDGGDSYELKNEGNGLYDAPPLNISTTKNYRLHIFTADENEYASDFVPVKITPPIDSVSWMFDSTGGINIYVNTHDITNNTQYYRWQFVQTWEHRSVDSSILIYDNGNLRMRLPQEQIYRCWNIIPSSEIFIASTTTLSSDVVFEKKLVSIPYKSTQFRWIYSILVNQYALTNDGFEYWTNLKKNTEQLGSIFDPQPFADFGNIHCITNTSEPVIGFISACSVQRQRIYIYYSQVHWPYTLTDCNAESKVLSENAEEFALNLYVPVRYVTPFSVIAYEPECIDCRNQGGTTTKPPYMP